MQPVDWVMHWWTHLQPGDKGTWAGGIATFMTLLLTLIISTGSLIITLVGWQRQRSREVKLRSEEQNAARRAHAEKFSCWVAGRLLSRVEGLPIPAGALIVALANASEQPFTHAAVEVELRDAQGSASTRWFSISAVPPGPSWFEFHDAGKPKTPLLSIWFLDNGMRSWCRSSIGTLEEDTEGQGRLRGRGAVHVWLHHGDIDKLELNDPRA
jgi:hypothetical protein